MANTVEILIGARDNAKLDLDSLKARLDGLARKVAEARVSVKGDKEAEAALDKLGVKLINLGRKVANPRISVEGAFKALAEIEGLDVAFDHLENKFGGGGLRMGINQAVQAMGGFAGMGSTLINPITIAIGFLVAIMAGPLIASLAPITLGFAGFAAGAVGEIKKVITAQQQLTAAQQQYAKATTKAGRQSALKAEQRATEGLTGSEKGLLGMLGQLSRQFSSLERAVRPEVIKAFGSALRIIRDLMPAIRPLAVAAGHAIDGFLKHIDNWLRSPSGQKFIHWLQTDGPHAIATFGKAMWAVTQVVGRTFAWLNNAGDTWWHNFFRIIHDAESGWRGLGKAADTTERVIGSAFLGAVSAIRSAWSAVYNTLVRPIESAYRTIAGIAHAIGSALANAAAAVNNFMGGLPGKALSFLGLASGGISGAATGGLFSGLRIVGEHGPELADLGPGARVYNNSQTAQMLGGGMGGQQTITIEIHPPAGAAVLGQEFWTAFANGIRVRGGSPQILIRKVAFA